MDLDDIIKDTPTLCIVDGFPRYIPAGYNLKFYTIYDDKSKTDYGSVQYYEQGEREIKKFNSQI